MMAINKWGQNYFFLMHRRYIILVVIVVILVVAVQRILPAGIFGENVPLNIPSNIRNKIILLFSKAPGERIKAAKALGAMGQRSYPAVPYLIELLDDQARAENLFDKEYNVFNPLGPAGTFVCSQVIDALVRIGSPAVDPLIAAFYKSQRPYQRQNALFALKRINDFRILDFLINVLFKESDANLRMWAAQGLGDSLQQAAIAPLLVSLEKEQDMQVLGYIITSLGKLRAQQAIDPLIETLKDKKLSIWSYVALYEITGQRFGEDYQQWRQNEKVMK